MRNLPDRPFANILSALTKRAVYPHEGFGFPSRRVWVPYTEGWGPLHGGFAFPTRRVWLPYTEGLFPLHGTNGRHRQGAERKHAVARESDPLGEWLCASFATVRSARAEM